MKKFVRLSSYIRALIVIKFGAVLVTQDTIPEN